MNILGRSRSARNISDLSFWWEERFLAKVPFGRRFFSQGAFTTSQGQCKLEAGVWLCLCHSWGSAASPILQLGGEEPWGCPGLPFPLLPPQKRSWRAIVCVGGDPWDLWGEWTVKKFCSSQSPDTTIFWRCCGRQPSPEMDGVSCQALVKGNSAGGQWISCQTWWKLTAHASLELGINCFL